MRFAIVFALLLVPQIIFAEHGSAGLVPCHGPDCTACDFTQLGQNILEFLIEVGVVIAVIAFAVGGFYMLSSGGNPGRVTTGRGIFTNAIIGLIILLAAWLIVDTAMKLLVDDQKLGPWNDVVCPLDGGASDGIDSDAETFPLEPSPPIEGEPLGEGDEAGDTGDDDGIAVGGDEGQYDHDDALALFESAGIEVTSTGGEQNVRADCDGAGCTSLDGLRASVAHEAVEIKHNCNCNVTIVGATEGGEAHSDGTYSHANGYKLDFDRNANSGALDAYLSETYGREEGRAYSTTFNSNDTYTFTKGDSVVKVIDEGSHWDVQVRPRETSA